MLSSCIGSLLLCAMPIHPRSLSFFLHTRLSAKRRLFASCFHCHLLDDDAWPDILLRPCYPCQSFNIITILLRLFSYREKADSKQKTGNRISLLLRVPLAHFAPRQPVRRGGHDRRHVGGLALDGDLPGPGQRRPSPL